MTRRSGLTKLFVGVHVDTADQFEIDLNIINLYTTSLTLSLHSMMGIKSNKSYTILVRDYRNHSIITHVFV